MTAVRKSSGRRRWARRVLPVVVATTAVVGASATPAYADARVRSADQDGFLGCAEGEFRSYGEWFSLTDHCWDGHSAVMRVDVEPLASGYDFVLWNPRGMDSVKSWNYSYPEGTQVCIQVGIGEYRTGTSWSFGRWDCTLA